MTPAIPRTLIQIWIGPYGAPRDWMQSWRDKHPDWTYLLIDNAALARLPFRTRPQISEYLRRGEYSGVADLVRLEVMFEHGGFLAEADSVCYRPIDGLFPRACAYSCYENELVRGQLISNVLAAEPRNPFVGAMIERLAATPPASLGTPWKSTGNLFATRMMLECRPDMVVFPSHYFIPVHYSGVAYDGPGPVYAGQKFGATRRAYTLPSALQRPAELLKRLRRKRALRAERAAVRALFDRSWPDEAPGQEAAP